MWPYVRWLTGLLRVGLVSFACGALLVPPAAVVYDLVRFHRVREHVDQALSELSPSERRPSADVQRAFAKHGSKQHFSSVVAWHLCRDGLCGERSRGVEQKVEAWLFWTPMLRLIYTDEQMFSIYLHHNGRLGEARGAGGVSRAAFGKDLNALSDRELYCVERLIWAGPHGVRRWCPEITQGYKQHSP